MMMAVGVGFEMDFKLRNFEVPNVNQSLGIEK